MVSLLLVPMSLASIYRASILNSNCITLTAIPKLTNTNVQHKRKRLKCYTINVIASFTECQWTKNDSKDVQQNVSTEFAIYNKIVLSSCFVDPRYAFTHVCHTCKPRGILLHICTIIARVSPPCQTPDIITHIMPHMPTTYTRC